MLYEIKKKLVIKILGADLNAQGIYNLEDGKDKPWMRVTLANNENIFKAGKDGEKPVDVIYRTAPFKQFDSRIEYLKNEQKENEESVKLFDGMIEQLLSRN